MLATIHTSAELSFMGEQFSCATSLMNITSESLSELVGTPLTTLLHLGMDILSQFKILFDYKAGFIGFSKDVIHMKGYTLPFSSYMKIPVIELSIDHVQSKVFLDSGARLSYLLPSLTAGRQSIGEETDFYPGLGSFQTPVFDIESYITGMPFSVKFGNLPLSLQPLLKNANV
jgi:hypothetical protein